MPKITVSVFYSFLIVVWRRLASCSMGGEASQGVCEVSKVCCGNRGIFFAVCGLRIFSFRFSPESADIPSIFIMPIITVFSFYYFPIVVGNRRAICSRGKKRQKGFAKFPRYVTKNGGHLFCFSWPWTLFFSMFLASADMPPRPTMPNRLSVFYSFSFLLLLGFVERCVLGWRNVSESLRSLQGMIRKLGDICFVFLWPWELFFSMFFGICRHTTQTYYAKNHSFLCVIRF